MGLFFNRWLSSPSCAYPIRVTPCQVFIQLSPPSPDRFHIQACYLRELLITATSNALGFKRNVPSPLLFIQTAQENIHFVMELPVCMVF
jgi:hypothetical protein